MPPTTILDFEAALAVVREHTATIAFPAQAETIPLLASRGRVLARPVFADRDQPPFDRSTRDGFAVDAAAFSAGQALRIVGSIRAGGLWTGPALAAGDAIEIMTGAPVPAGANAVAMVEHVAKSSGTIAAQPGRPLVDGENIVPQGSEAAFGEAVLAEGTVLGAAEIALAASCGRVTLAVTRRPRVAIVATGDELVELNQTPGPQQIRNSNSYAIAALVEAAGGEATRLAIAPDEREAIAARLREAHAADLIVLSGGVSMGEYDLVEEMLAAIGARFLFTGVRMQPGRPVVFGELAENSAEPPVFFFGLPGNPISVQVTFQCFVAPLLRALAGEGVCHPRWAQATLDEPVAAKPGVTRLLPARLDGIAVRTVGWQGSGDLTANARGNCYAEILPGRAYQPGDLVRILPR
jgi:molybdopterin molybdotransferase